MDKPVNVREVFLAPLLTWAILCALLAVTCALAFVPMGKFNLPVSLAIAAVKALLIGWFFMRLREDQPLNRLLACIGPAWILIMLVLMGADYFTR